MTIHQKIIHSIKKFNLNLRDKKVLTEAASGNYIFTPIIAAISGAEVVALTKKSKYASTSEVIKQTNQLAESFNVKKNINIIKSYEKINLSTFDILTNTGFNRPINKDTINQLSSKCVIPLMWEPWEYRPSELDIDSCEEKGIKVYGTNESDPRLKTMLYIGYTVLYFLLNNKKTPFSSNILILGDKHFGKPISDVIKQNNYNYIWNNDYSKTVDLSNFDTIVFAEHNNDRLLLGENGYLNKHDISEDMTLIHIAGNVDFDGIKCIKSPSNPANFGYMSYTTDFIDNTAVIDLHTAGLKVAEGMLEANSLMLSKSDYKNFMETNYPALAFTNKKYW